jgi:hypothetical protein
MHWFIKYKKSNLEYVPAHGLGEAVRCRLAIAIAIAIESNGDGDRVCSRVPTTGH